MLTANSRVVWHLDDLLGCTTRTLQGSVQRLLPLVPLELSAGSCCDKNGCLLGRYCALAPCLLASQPPFCSPRSNEVLAPSAPLASPRLPSAPLPPFLRRRTLWHAGGWRARWSSMQPTCRMGCQLSCSFHAICRYPSLLSISSAPYAKRLVEWAPYLKTSL